MGYLTYNRATILSYFMHGIEWTPVWFGLPVFSGEGQPNLPVVLAMPLVGRCLVKREETCSWV